MKDRGVDWSVVHFTISSVSFENMEMATHTPANQNGDTKHQEQAPVQNQLHF